MKVSQYQKNQQIEALIDRKDFSGEEYSREELGFISAYRGSGGQAPRGAKGTGVLYEFYTPPEVTRFMWALASHYGYREGSVLEPSIGSGELALGAPDGSEVTGFETNRYSARIAELRLSGSKVYRQFFETAFLEGPRYANKAATPWIKGYPFSLVIGNPPYGVHANRYSSFFTSPQMPNLESFFLYYGLQLLKPGGLLVYLIPQAWLRTGFAYNKAKEACARLAVLRDAYRLPPVFEKSQIPVDIVVYQRKLQ